ncbi:BT4734/BF3469 family protein [Lutibacter sp.]|uniref:BT4734/BF3469 family protein n=1 Tax=Lutibacter sp. TaxID=1925666 RepID=UPI002735020F|nr:BT4734/BF3469 family protein [Lutibacter sp.]MDP3314085.1 BT4734/BF3469 family protein [Lutibacter sp.]
MLLSKEAILDKTHSGLTIYAYVLHQYYPNETVLTLSGRDCRITKNPFNKDKETLSVRIVNEIAIHTDIELDTFKGDVFVFAQLYFKAENETALLHKINSALNLNLEVTEVTKKDDLNWLSEPDNAWVALCSFYKAPIRNVYPFKTLKLSEIHSLIKSDAYKDITIKLREFADPKEKRIYKANNFDYVTFSGEFERRNEDNLIRHSSLITIDFDHLENINEVKNQLLQDEYFETEMLFTSPSGDGLKWIIKIDLSQATHQVFFKAVANYLKESYNLEVDQSGKDISRACFLAYDPLAFLNKKHSIQ